MTEGIPKSNKLGGKVAIITGGASGIGEATVRLFANEGARMVVIANIQDELGQLVVSNIGLHYCCSYVRCDVTDENQVKYMVEATVQKYGTLDIMFSNAGTIHTNQTILDLDLEKMDRLFAINVRGMAACVKYGARTMVEGGVKGGSIICTASVRANKGSPMLVDYGMSKHAVLGLIRSASCELGKYGIRVNCVSPAAAATPLVLKSFGYKDIKTAENAFLSTTSLSELALTVNHVADAVLYLASDQSAVVSGHDLVVDGGYLSI